MLISCSSTLGRSFGVDMGGSSWAIYPTDIAVRAETEVSARKKPTLVRVGSSRLTKSGDSRGRTPGVGPATAGLSMTTREWSTKDAAGEHLAHRRDGHHATGDDPFIAGRVARGQTN